jgi:predicted nucleic acid-binding protein
VSVLVDTNILLRRTQPGHPHHEFAVGSVERLLASGEPVHFSPQNIAEFWSVATRPAERNGLGFTSVIVQAEVKKIEEALEMLADIPAIYEEWKRLVVGHGVRGVQVHDARLVAVMNVHRVTRLLTFNAADFVRYPIEVLQPAAVSSGP